MTKLKMNLKSCGANYKKLTLDQIINDTAKALLAEEKAVGWFQGQDGIWS
jgi:predicted NodU family carbamoyl transferase